MVLTYIQANKQKNSASFGGYAVYHKIKDNTIP
jgi:hypothetical protein